MFALGPALLALHPADGGHRGVPQGEVRRQARHPRGQPRRAARRLQLRRDDRGLRGRLRGRPGHDAGRAPTATSPATSRCPTASSPPRTAPACRSCLGSYPITPASDILHTLAGLKRFGVTTLQAEDEIAGVGAALGAAFGGALGVTTTSGPGPRAQGRDDRPGGVARAAAVVSTSSAAARRPACRPRPSRPTCCRRCSAATASRRSPSSRRAPRPTASTPPLEAVRIATTYRTPVCCSPTATSPTAPSRGGCPDVADLPDLRGRVRDRAQRRGRKGQPAFHPYLRDPGDPRPAVGRPRHAGPRAPDRRHREGRRHRQHLLRPRQPRPHDPAAPGQDRRDRRRHRAARGRRPDRRRRRARARLGLDLRPDRARRPPGRAAPAARVAQAHLRHLNPFPANTGEVLRPTSGSRARDEPRPARDAAAGEVPRRRAVAHPGARPAVHGGASSPTSSSRRRRGRRAERRHRRSEPRRPEHRRPRHAASGGTGTACRASADGDRADEEGLHLRPGGALVPRLRRLRDPRRGAGLPARARPQAREHRLRLGHRLLLALPLLPRHLRHALDPRPRPGHRDRPGRVARRTSRSGSSPATATRSRSAATT